MMEPVKKAFDELLELESAILLEPARAYEGGLSLAEAMLLQAQKVEHAASRFTLVSRMAGASGENAESLVPLLHELVANTSMLVSAVQFSTQTGTCCKTRRSDVQSAGRAVLRAVAALAQSVRPGLEAAEAGKPFTDLLSHAADSLLYQTGEVMQACARVGVLPSSDSAAVRRRVLQCAVLVKRSLSEIGEEHSGILRDGATVAPIIPARGNDGDDYEDEDDDDDAPGSELPADTIRSGLRSLQLLLRVLKQVLACLPAGSIERLDATTVDNIDGVALACASLCDAVIDYAAALNDGDAEELLASLPLVSASLPGFSQLITAASAGGGPEIVELTRALEASEDALGQLRTALASIV